MERGVRGLGGYNGVVCCLQHAPAKGEGRSRPAACSLTIAHFMAYSPPSLSHPPTNTALPKAQVETDLAMAGPDQMARPRRNKSGATKDVTNPPAVASLPPLSSRGK
jgi:hypothetical protein